ncbi:unnamed protein product [Rangifer tarandus platyrhynchus]|uniref:Uncharacterized protein n=2 Tax=Rangifer tarandus platyrhynchus TaxID=3082113 RepID=A0ACB0DR90_RANTA|nr:unnamed protein product [Rangifer tarandus platyrhynchus]CAI9690740.1 unnamed protein product [Rangifer tarandus platyrhynchus]
MAAILQLSQYCTFRTDSISTVITEPGQPVSHRAAGILSGRTPSDGSPGTEALKDPLLEDSSRRILHVNNIQALFTVAAGQQGTHASCLEAGGGGGKSECATFTHTRPAPPRHCPARGPERDTVGLPAPSFNLRRS